MRSHSHVASALLSLTTACLLLAPVAGPAHAAFRHTFGTMLKVTQVKPVSGAAGKSDKRIPEDVLKALQKEFGKKYSAYTFEAQEVREAAMGEDEVFGLVNHSELTLRVVGYKPSTKLIDLKVQTEDDIQAVSVRSGGHIILTFDVEQGPLIVVITVKLLQIER